MTSDSCLNCGERPQDGPFGQCSTCRRERRERVRASIAEDSSTSTDEAGEEEPTQGTLDAWGGGD